MSKGHYNKISYQPNRSQQLVMISRVREVLNCPMDDIIIHHVLEDSPVRLYVQIERRSKAKVSFERLEL